MRIKFSKKDPRAGMEIEIEDFRANELIEAGYAERVDVKAVSAPENKAVASAPANKSKGKK